MSFRTLRQPALALVALALSLGPYAAVATAQGRTQKVSAKLIERAEDMVKDLGKTRSQVAKASNKYDAIFKAGKVKDRRKVYKDLLDEIKKSEEMVKGVRKRADDIQKEADKFFNEWSKGLAKITDNQLRLLGHTNMTEGRERYGQVVEAGLRAGGLYSAFVTDLKNQCSYLDVDMSDAALGRLAPNRAQTSQRATALFQSADQLTNTTRGYIASMK